MTKEAGVKLVQSDSETCPPTGRAQPHPGLPSTSATGEEGRRGLGPPPPERAAVQVGWESRWAQVGCSCPDQGLGAQMAVQPRCV